MKLLPCALAFFWCAALSAQTTQRPLGLLRLKSNPGPTDPAPLAAAKFTVDDLSAAGATGAAKNKRNNLDYLALDAGREWFRPLRGNGQGVTFVSFQLHASEATMIDIAGARLGLVPSPAPGPLQLMFDDASGPTLQWKALNYHVAAARFDTRTFAALPTLTVAIDSALGVWHLYSGSHLLADHLPLVAAKRNDRRFVLTAGNGDAWLTGLVLADENPIYADDNANGIDDAFERAQRGGSLLPATATLAERKQLAQQWRDSQRIKPPPAFFVQRLLPDSSAH